MDLKGASCLLLTMVILQREGIAHTQSSSRGVTAETEIMEALSYHASGVGENLRAHQLLARTMTVFVQTNAFDGDPFYSYSTTFDIEPTQDTFALIEDALRGARRIFRPAIATGRPASC